jgi:hypothetical protein
MDDLSPVWSDDPPEPQIPWATNSQSHAARNRYRRQPISLSAVDPAAMAAHDAPINTCTVERGAAVCWIGTRRCLGAALTLVPLGQQLLRTARPLKRAASSALGGGQAGILDRFGFVAANGSGAPSSALGA